ncbi:FUSC family protein [Gordonia caeni]|uniref:Integral membrane bound transporter domain-containing protein n=1 Tax=Gordonia caeni TaxID=1007097 RepID=A0ABP7NLQ7_9ACTN
MQHHVPFWRRVLVATDPGRLRLINACTVAIAVLISTVIAWLLVTFAHADHALLAMGAFLALQMGLVVKDPVDRDRVVSTALLAVPIVTGLCVATLLARWHWLEIVVFVGVGGTATWLRRFGPRAWAVGAMAFFAYFFALFLRPSLDQLPEFCLVAVCAVGSVLLVRLATARPHPQRRIAVLLAELRGAGSGALAAAIATAPGDDLSKTLHTRLARVDTVSRSINAWQTQFSTGHVIDCDATTFATRVLDARIDTDHACLEIAERLRDGDPDLTRLVAEPVADLGSVLASRTPPDAVRATAERAAARLSARRSATPAQAAAAITDRAVIAQARLREVDLRHPLPEPERPADPGPAPGPATPGAPVPPWWQPWKRWAATTRMAVQVMVATGLATIVGEAISADRWYWAVLTAFIVFVGTTTRGAILTRASHRVLGTFAGVTVGFALALLLDGNVPGLIVMCVGAVFCTLYFGPLLYAVQAFFMTVVLTAMYGLLGVLDRHILELRLAETVAGAAIGVICAYLVFSTSSRPALRAGVNHYFDVLDALLEDIRAALTGTGAGRQLLDEVCGGWIRRTPTCRGRSRPCRSACSPADARCTPGWNT